MSDALVHTTALMGTVVTFHVVGHGSTERERGERAAGVDRAIGWFQLVSDTCSRFEAKSELAQLSARVGEAVPVSALLYEAVRFALGVAEASDGAFDPTVGRPMEALGFDKEFRTGHTAHIGADEHGSATFRDVLLDPKERTISLRRPMVLDLGAVAKGLAIDMAARELLPFEDFAIDAGGDLYFGGRNQRAEPWSVGIRHPRDPHAIVETLRVSNAAVCTSGDYERPAPVTLVDAHGATDGVPDGVPDGAPDSVLTARHHILDPRRGSSAAELASVTVVAPTAMVADALSTAAFVLGPAGGVAFLERNDVDGILLSATLDRFATRGFRSEFLFEQPASESADAP